jgi:putative aminopeptidase FrvX
MIDYLMSEMTRRVCSILDEISRPSAPFYERHVAGAVMNLLDNYRTYPGTMFYTDRYGNIVAYYRHPEANLSASLVTVAHMDHPGFHIESANGNSAVASIQGGLPRDNRIVGLPILIFRGSCSNKGSITGFVNDDKNSVNVTLDTSWDGPVSNAWAVPDVTRFAIKDNLIHGRAMDDLAGCAQQIAVFETIVREAPAIEYTAVFTRAEEVGFIGAVGACETGVIPQNAVVVSLEASKNLEGARPGHGIILRTGDRQAVFDVTATELLEKAAESARIKGVDYQKRRMDGGTCEASLFMACGYETGALAVPLINYHNHGDSAVEAEAIHKTDLAGGIALLIEAAAILASGKRVARSLFLETRKTAFYKKRNLLLKDFLS